MEVWAPLASIVALDALLSAEGGWEGRAAVLEWRLTAPLFATEAAR